MANRRSKRLLLHCQKLENLKKRNNYEKMMMAAKPKTGKMAAKPMMAKAGAKKGMSSCGTKKK